MTILSGLFCQKQNSEQASYLASDVPVAEEGLLPYQCHSWCSDAVRSMLRPCIGRRPPVAPTLRVPMAAPLK